MLCGYQSVCCFSVLKQVPKAEMDVLSLVNGGRLVSGRVF